ncbi:unnamed protein product [Caenorhabditis brenneri]
MHIPLLRLPVLASIVVIKQIDVKYFITLLQLSRRSYRLVKLSKVHINLHVFKSRLEFEKEANPGIRDDYKFLVQSENPVFQPPNHQEFITVIQYEIAAYQKIIDDFMNIFVVKSVSFDLEAACSYNSCCYLEYAKSLGLKFTSVTFEIDSYNTLVHQRLLTIGSHASKLTVMFDTDESFEFNGFHEYKMDKFRFFNYYRNINWFTVDHLCSLVDCTEFEGSHINWESEDFNKFLEFWMASDTKLKSVILWNHSIIEPEIVLEGIHDEEIIFDLFTVDHMCSLLNCLKVEVSMLNWSDEDFNRLLKFWMASNGRLRSVVLFNNKKMRPDIVMREINRRELIDDEPIEIQREDGVKADVTCGCNRFSLKVIDE